jgi:two-component system sensor histidine kinase/response regulator
MAMEQIGDLPMSTQSISSLAERKFEGKPLVLVVDDNPGQQKLFLLISEALGLMAYIVADCEEAVAASTYFCFDVILMDVQLTGESGLSCTKRIREIDKMKGRHTPIIAVTAHAMLGDKERCLESGMDDYLSKPFTMAELKKKLARWIQEKTEPVAIAAA